MWRYCKLTGVLGNGQRQCWVHELTSLSIRALRVFHSKNSVVILYTAIRGGGGTEAAGYQPSDVCTLTVHLAQLAYKLELTSIQGRMLVNGWHMMAN